MTILPIHDARYPLPCWRPQLDFTPKAVSRQTQSGAHFMKYPQNAPPPHNIASGFACFGGGKARSRAERSSASSVTSWAFAFART